MFEESVCYRDCPVFHAILSEILVGYDIGHIAYVADSTFGLDILYERAFRIKCIIADFAD